MKKWDWKKKGGSCLGQQRWSKIITRGGNAPLFFFSLGGHSNNMWHSGVGVGGGQSVTWTVLLF